MITRHYGRREGYVVETRPIIWRAAENGSVTVVVRVR